MCSPLVITAAPARSRSMLILGVMPRPLAEFSPLTMMKSIPCSSRMCGNDSMTARRPGSPTMSPRKRILMSIGRQDKPHGQGFNRILAILVGAWFVAATPAFAQRLSPLGERPDWSELERYQQSISREDFVCLLQTLYAPTGGWESYIFVGPDRAWLVTDS